MDVERALVSKLIGTGEIEKVISRGINEDHFADEDCLVVYGFCLAHLRKYKEPPSLSAVKDKFPMFEPELTQDAIEYLIDEFVVLIKRRQANESIMALADAAEDPERSANIDIEFLDVARDLAQAVPTTQVARFSDMKDRIERYEKDREEGNIWGIKMGIPALDEKTLGIQDHELIICAGWQGTGKALGFDTPIPTPTGWTTQGEIEVGDELFDDKGEVCKVTAVAPIMLDRPCMEVAFEGGEKIVADIEHEWLLRDSRNRMGVLETQEISGKLTRSWKSGETKNLSVVIPRPLRLGAKHHKPLPIDPYCLGVWLGDGHSGGGRITTADSEIIDYFSELYEVRKNKASLQYGVIGLQTQLRENGLLGNKHIPRSYMRSSIFHRLALLRGLMDSDGTIDDRGCCEYCTTKRGLAIGVEELLLTLGFKPSISEEPATFYGDMCGTKYRIYFRSGRSPEVFKLTRKLTTQRNAPHRQRSLNRFVMSVENVGSVPVRCIEVGSSSGCYLVGKTMVPTHNSTLMQHISFSAYLQGKTILFVSLEMDRGPLLRKFDAMAVDLNYRELKGLELGDEAIERWEKWAEDAEEGRDHGKDIIIIDRIGSRTAMGIFAETIRYKPDLVVVDYISLLETAKAGAEQHWQKIGNISRELKLNAQTIGVPVVAAAQTNRDSVKEGVKLETIAFSSSIGMDSDIVLGLQQDEDMKADEQMEIVMVKNRDGAPGKAVMDWKMDNMQFGEKAQFTRKKKDKTDESKEKPGKLNPFGRKKK